MFILANMGKDQEFLEAARNGNITVVEKILNQKAKRTGPLASLRRGPGANVQDSSGYSALHHAALNGHNDIVRLLLAHDASPNLPDSRGSSPLHLAAWAGHQDIVKLFLIQPNRPANPNLQTIEHETPLHYAAQHGHTGALTTLLAHGADPNVMNSRNETPLDLAAQYGRLQVVQMLIRAHPELLLQFRSENISSSASATSSEKPIIFDHTPLHLASRNGHKSVVEVLLAAGVNVNVLTPSGTALHEAALCGKDTIVRTLLDSGADLDATDCEGRTALDILEEFPPHVTKGIVSVINNHRNSMIYDSESDDIRDTHHHIQKNHTTPMSLGSSYENNRGSPVQNYFNSHYGIATSPSSSVGSFGPSSPSSKPRTSLNDLPELYITMTPIKQQQYQQQQQQQQRNQKTAPKKPPRRNLSISPTHLQQAHNQNKSFGGSTEDTLYHHHHSNSNSNVQNLAAYEYICLARTGKRMEEKMNRAVSVDQYVEMKPAAAPRNQMSISYENTTFKSYNPNRKLKRNRNIYEPFNIDFNKDKFSKDNIPQSPTNYQQPPTPEHPPPTAMQAEKCIHERIRPLSQEYKRRSGNNFMIETSTSPPDILCSSLCASSGSISSSVSISDRSISTDCVEEFIGDVPFAGLFKGSTINLNNTNSNYPAPRNTSSSSSSSRYLIDKRQDDSVISPKNHERPKTLHSSQQQYQNAIKQQQQQQKYQKDYRKNRSHSFGGLLDDCKNSDDNLRTSSISPSSSSISSGILNSNSNSNSNRHHSIINHQLQSQSLCINSSDSIDEDYYRHQQQQKLQQHQQQQKQHNQQQQQQKPKKYNDEQRENLRSKLQNDFKAYLSSKTAAFLSSTSSSNRKNELQNNHHNNHEKNDLNEKDNNKLIKNNHEMKRSSEKLTSSSYNSSFDEKEAWAKISEIMESFGSDILTISGCDGKKQQQQQQQQQQDTDENIKNLIKDLKLTKLLDENNLQKYESVLVENGFDNIEFLNGILDESDLKTMNIPIEYHDKLLEIVKKLPVPKSLPILHKDNNNTILNVDQWLQSINLIEYIDIFKHHSNPNMEGVCRVWEVELQTVLEIQKIGHRKRILHSISNNRVLQTSSIDEINIDTLKANIMELRDDFVIDAKLPSEKIKIKQQSDNNKTSVVSGIRYNKKNRPAPKPPIFHGTNIEIRAPSELLLGLPSNLQTQWRHTANSLINGSVKYDAYYLGSTVVKELRGTESTRKSIQKLKKDNRSSLTASNINLNNQQQNHQVKKQPIRLSISYRGVEFIDIEGQKTICEHAIRNINCACQDADDLSHFAYITKDSDINTHYCHVFNVDSMDLATEIILTIGQAFEVAYQLALRDGSKSTTTTTTSMNSISSACKIPPSSSSSTTTNTNTNQ